MYLEFFREVVRRTAQLVAAWQCVGFCHGARCVALGSILGLASRALHAGRSTERDGLKLLSRACPVSR